MIVRRLWPRALLTPFTDSVTLTNADRKAYTSYARAQRHKGFEEVTVKFAKSPHELAADGGGADGRVGREAEPENGRWRDSTKN